MVRSSCLPLLSRFDNREQRLNKSRADARSSLKPNQVPVEILSELQSGKRF